MRVGLEIHEWQQAPGVDQCNGNCPVISAVSLVAEQMMRLLQPRVWGRYCQQELLWIVQPVEVVQGLERDAARSSKSASLRTHQVALR